MFCHDFFVPFPALTLLVLVAIISTMEARSPLTKMAKMNKVAKMEHQATLVQKVMDDCDFAHWCPNGCCDQETDMGNVRLFKNNFSWVTLNLLIMLPYFIRMGTGLAAPTLPTSVPWIRTPAIPKCRV